MASNLSVAESPRLSVPTPQSAEPAEASVFRRSLPVVIPSFVNKCGDIGMRLFPMLLVAQQLTTKQSATVMFLVKSMTVVATLVGGFLSDRIGHQRAIMIAMAFSGVGMLALPFSTAAAAICVAGMVTTFGHGLFNAPQRLLLIDSVGIAGRKDALAWLRTSNNGAVLTANLVAYVAGAAGLATLFFFDAATSFVALALIFFWSRRRKSPSLRPPVDTAEQLSGTQANAAQTTPAQSATPMPQAKWLLPLVVFLLSGFTLLLELFFIGASAQARLVYGERGVEVFAQVMMINTVLCLTLNLVASRHITNVVRAFVTGFVLIGAALVLFLARPETMAALFFGAFLLTIGELVFTSVGQYVLLGLIPAQGRQGRAYAMALTVQLLFKTLGGALAFPLLGSGSVGIGAVIVLTVVLCLATLPLRNSRRAACLRTA